MVQDGNRLPRAVSSSGPSAARLPLVLRFIGKEASGFHDASSLNIMKCDVGIRDDLYANVVLLHRFRGSGERMAKALAADWTACPVFPRYIPAMWIPKGNYDESGLPRAHDADHVQDVQRSRHVRGDPGRFVSVVLVTREPKYVVLAVHAVFCSSGRERHSGCGIRDL